MARLAQTPQERLEAQELRYHVFYEEGSALPLNEMVRQTKVDQDILDNVCDHLIVIDQETHRVVGTYRLITREAAKQSEGFFSQAEYDISPLLIQENAVLELGRACESLEYRTKGVIKLLWTAILPLNSTYSYRISDICLDALTFQEQIQSPLGTLYPICIIFI